MAKGQPKLDLTVQGVTGLPVWSGRVYDEVLMELQGERGRKIYREMSEQDPVIGGILLGVEMLSRGVSWTMKPAEFPDDEKKAEKAKEVAEFVDECLTDMHPSWENTLSEILSMLKYGWSWLEIVYKKREGMKVNSPLRSSHFDDGKIGWGSWSIRSQESHYRWLYENSEGPGRLDTGELIAMVQRGAPDYVEHIIPRAKSLHFTTRSQRENPEGVSFLRSAYRAWYMKKNIEVIEAIGIERDLAGLPVMWAPAELFSKDADDGQKALFATLRKIVTEIKRDEQEGVLMPMAYDEDKNPLYKLELLSTGGERQVNTNEVIGRYNEMEAMSMLADFILMGHQAVGSYALSTTKTGLFASALDAILDMLASEINQMGVAKLVLLNGYDLEMSPTLMHGKIESADLAKLGAFLKALSDAGMAVFPNPALEKYLLEEAGIPAGDGAGELPFPVDEAGNPIGPDGRPLVPAPPMIPATDPKTGLPMVPAQPQLPAAGPGGNNRAPNPTGNKPSPASKPEAARTSIRSGVKPARAGEAKHFVPLATRVAKLAPRLSSMLEDEEYTSLLTNVMAAGKFSALAVQDQEAILAAESTE